MSRTSTIYEVLIASPSDVKAELQAVEDVIRAWNNAHSEGTGAVLLPVRWETHATPALGDRPQAIINKQIVENADILVGMFWTRIGTPTGEAESGSVEEINGFLKRSRPVLLYFSSFAVPPDTVYINAEQYKKLVEFRETIRKQGLAFDYETLPKFRELLYAHLHKTVTDLQRKKQRSPSGGSTRRKKPASLPGTSGGRAIQSGPRGSAAPAEPSQLSLEAARDIGLALHANAENRTYTVVGAEILRKKQEDRWTEAEVNALRKAIYSSVSSRGLKIGTAAKVVVAESEATNEDTFVRISFSVSGVATFLFGWREDPFPVATAIAALIAGVRMLLSKEFVEAYDPIGPMDVTLGLVNWPEHGLSVGNLWGLAQPRPLGNLKGLPVQHKFTLRPDDVPWSIVGPFLSYVLADAGFIGYERYVTSPPPYAVLVDYLTNTGLYLT